MEYVFPNLRKKLKKSRGDTWKLSAGKYEVSLREGTSKLKHSSCKISEGIELKTKKYVEIVEKKGTVENSSRRRRASLQAMRKSSKMSTEFSGVERLKASKHKRTLSLPIKPKIMMITARELGSCNLVCTTKQQTQRYQTRPTQSSRIAYRRKQDRVY